MDKNILLIDSDMTHIEDALRILSDCYNLATAGSAMEAVGLLNTHIPDLILMDIGLPDINGLDFIKLLKSNTHTKTIPIIVLTDEPSQVFENEAFNAGVEDFVSIPFNPAVLKTRIKHSLDSILYQRYLQTLVHEQADTIGKHTDRINRMQQDIIAAMANIIESRDGSTGEHVKRTAIYVKLLLEMLKESGMYPDILTEDNIDRMCRAAYLHDIGKIKVDDAILRKAGSLTDAEFDTMKLHSKFGGEIIRMTMSSIEDKAFVDIAYDMATFHHEKWDGTGYAEGLSGTDIPLPARIMAIADVFDALTSNRCYKNAISVDETISIMASLSGVQFDPELIDVFIKNRKIFAEAVVRSSSAPINCEDLRIAAEKQHRNGEKCLITI